jgi:transcription elongation factor GreA
MSEYMSPEGYAEALKRLEALKDKRVEISAEIGRAIGFGDISENAEYDAAKDKQAMVESRIGELESKLSRAQVIDNSTLPDDKILVGTTVTLEDLSDGEEIEYTMVSALEADPDLDKISVDSPVGQALLTHEVGDTVKIEVPVGTLKYKVLKIERR